MLTSFHSAVEMSKLAGEQFKVGREARNGEETKAEVHLCVCVCGWERRGRGVRVCYDDG